MLGTLAVIEFCASIKTGSAKVKAGKVGIRLACIGGFRCKGTLTLRAGATRIGSAHYSIAAGKTSTVTLRLNAAGKSKLAASANHRLETTGTATVVGAKKATRAITLIGAAAAPAFTG